MRLIGVFGATVSLALSGCFETRAPALPDNQAPQAKVSVPAQVLEGSEVVLDASASSDPDGRISAYRWQQIANGAPVVSLVGADAAVARFTAPATAANTEYVFELTVTDDLGAQASTVGTLAVRPTPGFEISGVTGHTAELGSVAEFTLRLSSEPADVVEVPVSSSDPAEGVVQPDRLVFGRGDWQIPQSVRVTGANPAVVDGEQDYQIVLGPAISNDPFYAQLDPDDVPMRGLALKLLAPDPLPSLAPEVAGEIALQTQYAGDGPLSYTLQAAPTGMTVDLSRGIVRWTPAATDAGQRFPVTVRVTDGARFDELSFEVEVLQPIPVTTRLDGGKLLIEDASTSLNGLQLSPLTTTKAEDDEGLTDLAAIRVERVEPAAAPPVPPHITRLTDVMLVRDDFAGALELRIPLRDLPADTDTSDARVFAYLSPSDGEAAQWVPLALDVSVTDGTSGPELLTTLEGMSGHVFIGLLSFDPAGRGGPVTAKSGLAAPRHVKADVAAIRCEPRQRGSRTDFRHQRCSSTQVPDFEVEVVGFGRDADATRWGGVRVEELVGWLLDSREAALALGLDVAQRMAVSVERIERRDLPGYVSGRRFERRLVLHLNSRNRSAQDVQAAVAHLLFHHAQARSRTSGRRALIDVRGHAADWLIEGFARWFEDEVFDALNPYRRSEPVGARILSRGLAAEPQRRDLASAPGQRFSFAKLVAQRCTLLTADLPTVFSVDLRDFDRSGLRNLIAQLAGAGCVLDTSLAQTDLLAALMAYYQYATQGLGRISLLDGDEPDEHEFLGPLARLEPLPPEQVDGLPAQGRFVSRVAGIDTVPPAGAVSFRVPAIAGTLPEGRRAELRISASRGVYVSIVGGDGFVGNDQLAGAPHIAFDTGERSTFVYDFGGAMPALFVSILNPDPSAGARVEAELVIRDESVGSLTLSSPLPDGEVDRRVVTVAGAVDEALRGVADTVVVNANGIESRGSVRADGSFAVQIVAVIGDNTITARALANGEPVSDELAQRFVGVEAASSGPNALLRSRLAIVLRWLTDGTDLDLYATDRLGRTIWYADRVQEPGSLDVDDTSGFGPEVISYRDLTDPIYDDGRFDVDVHYFSGGVETPYRLDLILNESEPDNRRLFSFASRVPLSSGRSSEDGPDGADGPFRHNDVLKVSCAAGVGICSLDAFDADRLIPGGNPGAGAAAAKAQVRRGRPMSEDCARLQAERKRLSLPSADCGG